MKEKRFKILSRKETSFKKEVGSAVATQILIPSLGRSGTAASSLNKETASPTNKTFECVWKLKRS